MQTFIKSDNYQLGLATQCLDGKYGDILELCLYNSVLTAMSTDGKKFTYVNQLASSDTDLSKREEWFTCACCPPNILRLFGQLGGYIWDETRWHDAGPTELVVHLYVASTYTLSTDNRGITVSQEGDFPRKGDVKFTVRGPPEAGFNLKLRIPAYAAAAWKVTSHSAGLRGVNNVLIDFSSSQNARLRRQTEAT